MTAPIQVAFLGAGSISELHAAALRDCDAAELKGIWNRTTETATRRAALFGCEVYESAQAVVADPAVDAVFVLTNMESHLEYAKLALDAGKHVLVEKPAASSIVEIEAMRDAAASAGVCCAPVHNYIYESGVMRTRALIDAGKLGDLVSVSVLYNGRTHRSRVDGGDGHSGTRAPEVHFGLGAVHDRDDVSGEIPTTISWRQANGEMARIELKLTPGRHRVILPGVGAVAAVDKGMEVCHDERQ